MLSIVIPTYEQHGHGAVMLAKLLATVRDQKFNQDYELVIADNSRNGKIWEMLQSYADLPLAYFQNRKSFGASENFNFGLDKAKYPLIKLMCQDDIFMTRTGLSLFYQALQKDKWVVSSSVHIDENNRTKFRKTVRYDPNEWDKNVVGMPSVIGFHANDLRFDVRLRTYCDLWFYRQLYDLYGKPGLILEYTIGQRFWKGSYSRTAPGNHGPDRLLIKSLLNDKRPYQMPGLRGDKINRVP